MNFFDYQKVITWVWDKTDEAAKVLFIIIGAYVLIRLVRILADRLVQFVGNNDPLTASERQLRAKTLAGIFKGVAKVTIVVIAGLTILDTCGISIAPLIAGVGVAGLAISFGAQNLIRDVISGFFILLENQFKVGDVIKTAGASGVVEDMNLRITVLRDLEGAAHFIPNGEIKVVSNLTKEYSRAVVNVAVAYNEDLDRVIQLLNKVGEEFSQDPLLGPNILEAPKVLGIEGFENSQITLRMVAKTRPLKQWEIARELRRRIKMAFDREQIKIFSPQNVIYSEAEQPIKTPSSTSSEKQAKDLLKEK